MHTPNAGLPAALGGCPDANDQPYRAMGSVWYRPRITTVSVMVACSGPEQASDWWEGNGEEIHLLQLLVDAGAATRRQCRFQARSRPASRTSSRTARVPESGRVQRSVRHTKRAAAWVVRSAANRCTKGGAPPGPPPVPGAAPTLTPVRHIGCWKCTCTPHIHHHHSHSFLSRLSAFPACQPPASRRAAQCVDNSSLRRAPPRRGPRRCRGCTRSCRSAPPCAA